MKFDIIGWAMSPYVLTFFTVFTGMVLGKIKFGKFKFGLSGPLFTGLVIGWWILGYANGIGEGDPGFKAAGSLVKAGVVPSTISTIFLIMFVAAIGLLASKDLGVVLKNYGTKFMVLGIIITFLGAVLCYGLTKVSPGGNPYEISGVYTAALSSSPGFAAALETTETHATNWVEKYEILDKEEQNKILSILDPSGKMISENISTLTEEQKKTFVKEATASTGAGHAVAYPFGIIIVIVAMNLIPKIFKIDIEKEKQQFRKEMEQINQNRSEKTITTVNFDLAAFALACFAGFTLGQLKINLGPIGYFSLGSTGGVLIGSLILGYIGKIGSFTFRMEPKVLGVIRDISLGSFVGIVGLKYGSRVVQSLTGGGIYLILISTIVAIVCMLVSFALGKYVFKINWIMLSGAICGGMTSTPGLGAAIDSVNSNEPASGYAATYPFALIGMVLFTIILHNLPY